MNASLRTVLTALLLLTGAGHPVLGGTVCQTAGCHEAIQVESGCCGGKEAPMPASCCRRPAPGAEFLVSGTGSERLLRSHVWLSPVQIPALAASPADRCAWQPRDGIGPPVSLAHRRSVLWQVRLL